MAGRKELVAALKAAEEDLRTAEDLVLERATELSAAQEGAEEAQNMLSKAQAALAEHQGGVVRGIGAVLRRLSPGSEPEAEPEPEVEGEDEAEDRRVRVDRLAEILAEPIAEAELMEAQTATPASERVPAEPVFSDGLPKDHVRVIRPEDRPRRSWADRLFGARF